MRERVPPQPPARLGGGTDHNLDPPWSPGGARGCTSEGGPPADVGRHHGGEAPRGPCSIAADCYAQTAFKKLAVLSRFSLRLPKRLELEIDPDLYERIEELSIRSGRSIPEIIQGLISCSFPNNPIETVLGESLS